MGTDSIIAATFCLDYYEDRPARAPAGRLFAIRGEGHMVSTVESLDDATRGSGWGGAPAGR
jgi:hypothetical protein